MQQNHPDDERLAALAASEADAVADSALVTHVSGCPRCGPMVDDMRTLHSALAALPDIQPSRPLRFLPAIPEPATRAPRWLGLLRGVTGPAMAVAVLLIVVGAFGTALNGLGAGGSAAALDMSNGGGRYGAASAAASGAAAESAKQQPANLGSSPSPAYPVAGGSNSASAASTATASPTHQDLFRAAHGPNAPGSSGQGEPFGPPFGLVLGAGVVLLAVAFVARAYLRRRSLA
jgi:hypothetical protein